MATHIDACFACRFCFPIAIGDSGVRGIDRVDPKSTFSTGGEGHYQMHDYDDSAVGEQWCEERRAQVTAYLQREGVEHGRIGDWPAWHVAPYVSIWAIESKKRPDSIGWWVICGDLPTDYVSAAEIKHPREAMRAISDEWRDQAKLMASGERHAAIRIGQPEDWASLAPLLETRASILLQWANDDSLWENIDRP